MAKRTKKQPPQEESGGAPEWMVTFSDCMTLLLTFFVLLLSFSSFDDKVFHKLRPSFSRQLPKVNKDSSKLMNSFNQPANFFKKDYPENGSESPTDPENKKSGAMEESFRDKFNKQKVFTVNSEEFFWAEGNVLTSQGRGVLSDMAAFLNLRKGKIVLSENSLSAVSVNNIDRSWVIMQYLASEGVNQNRFSLSTNTTLSTAERVEKSDRIVEIVLLESELSR